MKTKLAIVFALCIGLIGCNSAWTSREREIIRTSDSLMYVTTIPADTAILRAQSVDLGPRELESPELQTLLAKMLRTVTDPSQDGVGIAAPQIGINRRLILVMRYDKPGEPIEPYLNIQIDSLLGEKVPGPEGCLSLPPYRGIVRRYPRVQISYVKPDGTPVTEKVEGYSAIIFQHERDHLDGILYTDRADTVMVNDNWAEERKGFSYEKPDWWR